MEIILTIPDEIAATAQTGSNGAGVRRLLELIAIELCRADVITSRQVQEMLGFEERDELFAFFKAHGIPSKVRPEHLERERATAAALFGESKQR